MNIVLDKLLSIVRIKRFNNKARQISKLKNIPNPLKQIIENNELQLKKDKWFLLNLIIKIAKNKNKEV